MTALPAIYLMVWLAFILITVVSAYLGGALIKAAAKGIEVTPVRGFMAVSGVILCFISFQFVVAMIRELASMY